MSRYVTRPPRSPRASDDWYDMPLVPELHVDGPKEVDTGLVDPHGQPIYRVQDPIGFHACS